MTPTRRAPFWLAVTLLGLPVWLAGTNRTKVTAAPDRQLARTVTLYDGALDTGTPDTQGFAYLARPAAPPLLASQAFADGVTTLTTTPQVGDSAGYFGRQDLYGTLDRDAGYSVRFTVQITAEDHAQSDKNGDGVADRAGFSVIVLSSDTRGIELGFWADGVWAQEDGAAEPPPNENTLFTHAEGAPFDTSVALTEYELSVYRDTYVLSSGGQNILTGRLRDYRAFGQFPYIVPNFLFLGDDTSTASATTRVSAASLEVALNEGGTPSPTPTAPTPTAVPTCPPATPEALSVDPVTSPTHRRSQTISASLGYAEWIEVTGPLGTFRSEAGDHVDIPIPLAPGQLNSLEVRGRVRRVGSCQYGGYELVTSKDRRGDPLDILQVTSIYLPRALFGP